MSDRKVVYGIEELRRAVKMFDRCNESFNQSFTAEELLDLWRHATTRETDEYPDEWTQGEIDAALSEGAKRTADGITKAFEESKSLFSLKSEP